MGVERIIINLHSETTVAADFHGIGKSIFLADGKEHFACGCFFGKGHAFYGHRAELILALRLVLFGKCRVVFVTRNAFLLLLYGLRIEFEHPVLKVVMLGQIALFEYTQL